MSNAFSCLIATWVVLGPGAASASPNAWPFDFDAQISPWAEYIDDQITELGAGLPGVPASALTEVSLGDVRLYLYPEMAEAFFRARDAGPGFADPLARVPQQCQQHAAFGLPALQLQSNLPACSLAKQQIEAQLANHLTACLYVEFPELYVLDYEAGPIPPSTLTSFEGLISLAGEALMHVDFQENLFPPDLILTTRDVIAKLRYETLLAGIDAQRLDYQAALDALDGAPGCFDPGEVAGLMMSLDGLQVELDEVRQGLVDLYDAGLAQAAADLAALVAQGRTRDPLMHPALSDEERLLLSFYIGGIYWRMRGAGLVAEPPDPDQGLLRRLYFVQYPYQRIGELNAGMLDSENVGFNVFVQENWGYADWMDMGTNPAGKDKYADLVDMTIRGKRATNLVAPLLSQRGYDTTELVYGGLMMGPCYYYAWEALRNYQLGPDLQYPYMWFLEGPTAIGEFCTGGTLALGLTRTLLWGKPGAACEGDCTGRACGDDGCGVSCGSCPPGSVCSDGICQACVADCTGLACGDDGCGGTCGSCPVGQVCQAGQCNCAPDCADRECGDDGCGGSCGLCVGNDVCQQGQCVCEPDCAGAVCGDDGCDGSCGSCPAGESCNASGQCVAGCVSNCTGLQCGDDGCGGSCGTCPAGESCDEGGQCVAGCVPACGDRQCGDDGCQGVCGTCLPGSQCQVGVCVPMDEDPSSGGCGCHLGGRAVFAWPLLGFVALLFSRRNRKQ